MNKNKSNAPDEINTTLLFRQAPMSILLLFFTILVYVLIVWHEVQGASLLIWFIVLTTFLMVRLLLVWRYLHHDPMTIDHRLWVNYFTFLAAGSGFCMGIAPYFFYAHTSLFHQLIYFALLGGVLSGGLSTLSSVPNCFKIYVLSVQLPYLYSVVKIGGDVYFALAFLGILYSLLLVAHSHRIYQTIIEAQKSRQSENYKNRLLEILTQNTSLSDILNSIVTTVETQGSNIVCSLLLLDDARKHIAECMAPSLPEIYRKAFIGLEIGPHIGSCGTAMYTGSRVIVENIAKSQYWLDYAELAANAGLHSCWSEPVKSSNGEIFGAFAIYHHVSSMPDENEIEQIETAAHLASLAIERRQFEKGQELAVLVYQNSSEAMLVMDANERVIAVNKAFTSITGYTHKDMVGKGVNFSARNAVELAGYMQMMESVLAIGKWQGELWNYRKNGERFASRVTVNSIRDGEDKLSRRVVLISDITEQKRSDELIWQQANYDPLIGIPNRRLFRDRLEQEIKKAHRSGLRMGLLFLDLDRFKEVNDSLGHDAGDKLLIEAAKRIASCVREADTFARLGGDEFTIILSMIEDNTIVERVARDIIEQMVLPFNIDNDLVYISVSIGITVYPDDNIDVDSLLKNADMAMYAAKDGGRNRFSYFTSATQKEAQDRVQMINDLHRALDAGEFELHYQPIIDMSTQQICKAEALLRWRHPIHGLVSPAQFIHRAEETGLINEIGDWAFREAAKMAKRLSDQTKSDFQLSVNVSPVQCYAMNDCQQWLACLEGLGLSGRSMTIEITEGLLLGADPHISNLLLALRNAGINVAIDDFGTGYSSLAYLKKFDVDFLKIDQSFVRDLAADPNDRALAETIIVMGHKLGLKVVAEGIETQEQCDILSEAGCDFGQGYLFSRPVPAEEFVVKLAANNFNQLTVVA